MLFGILVRKILVQMWPKLTNSWFILPLCLCFFVSNEIAWIFSNLFGIYQFVHCGKIEDATSHNPHCCRWLGKYNFHLVVWKIQYQHDEQVLFCSFSGLEWCKLSWLQPDSYTKHWCSGLWRRHLAKLLRWPNLHTQPKCLDDRISSDSHRSKNIHIFFIGAFSRNSVPFFQACNLAFWLEPIEPVCPLSSNWCQSIWTVLATSPWLWGSGTWEAVELLTHQPGLALECLYSWRLDRRIFSS